MNKKTATRKSTATRTPKPDMSMLINRIDSYYKAKYRGYNAAKVDRLRADMRITPQSTYDEIKNSLKILIARSRDAFNNNSYAKAIVNIYLSNIVCEGIKPTPRVKNPDGTEATEINKAIKKEWDYFNDYCDITGKSTFYEMQNLALSTNILTGGTFTNTVVDPKFKNIPIRFQLFGQDMLDFNHDTYAEAKSKQNILCGVKVNNYMQPLSYFFGTVIKTDEYLAENIAHTFIKQHPDQLLGVPWLTSALLGLHDIDTLIEDFSVASRIQAAVVYWLEKNTDDFKPDDIDDEDNLEVSPGAVWRTKKKPEVIQTNDAVSKVVEPLIKIILHATAVGQGFSYGLLTRDLNNSNFSASRANTAEDRRFFSTKIKWFYKDFCQKNYEKFMKYAVLAGKIPGVSITAYNRDSWRFNQCSWSTNAWEYINPQQDVSAATQLKDKGLLTDEEYHAQQGKNYQDVYAQLAKEKKERESLGLERTVANASA